jgi:hypothetical protein
VRNVQEFIESKQQSARTAASKEAWDLVFDFTRTRLEFITTDEGTVQFIVPSLTGVDPKIIYDANVKRKEAIKSFTSDIVLKGLSVQPSLTEALLFKLGNLDLLTENFYFEVQYDVLKAIGRAEKLQMDKSTPPPDIPPPPLDQPPPDIPPPPLDIPPVQVVQQSPLSATPSPKPRPIPVPVATPPVPFVSTLYQQAKSLLISPTVVPAVPVVSSPVQPPLMVVPTIPAPPVVSRPVPLASPSPVSKPPVKPPATTRPGSLSPVPTYNPFTVPAVPTAPPLQSLTIPNPQIVPTVYTNVGVSSKSLKAILGLVRNSVPIELNEKEFRDLLKKHPSLNKLVIEQAQNNLASNSTNVADIRESLLDLLQYGTQAVADPVRIEGDVELRIRRTVPIPVQYRIPERTWTRKPVGL